MIKAFQARQGDVLVQITTSPIPKSAVEVDHIDRLKTNNCISNLEAVPGLTNMERAKAAGAFRHVGRHDGIRDVNGRFGKKSAGRLLDAVEHNEMPGVKS